MQANMNAFFATFKDKEFWKELPVILLGLLAGAAAIYYFLIPSNLVLGSISGLAMVVSKVTEGLGVHLSVSTLVLIFNAILLVLAYVCLGPEIGVKTVIASLLFGPFMKLCEIIYPYEKLIEPGMNSVMGDPIFDLLAYVLLLGISQAFLFRINASTGGLDVVAMLMRKYLDMEMGTCVTIAGIIVCLTAIVVNPFRMVVIGIIGTWFNGLVVDYFTASLNKRKRVCIITPDYERIRQYIITDLHRGCSLYETKGGYTGETNVEIQSILTQHEFASLMEYVRKNCPHAFITAGNCGEVYGLWFHNKRH